MSGNREQYEGFVYDYDRAIKKLVDMKSSGDKLAAAVKDVLQWVEDDDIHYLPPQVIAKLATALADWKTRGE
jgi:hypothetical protein